MASRNIMIGCPAETSGSCGILRMYGDGTRRFSEVLGSGDADVLSSARRTELGWEHNRRNLRSLPPSWSLYQFWFRRLRRLLLSRNPPNQTSPTLNPFKRARGQVRAASERYAELRCSRQLRRMEATHRQANHVRHAWTRREAIRQAWDEDDSPKNCLSAGSTTVTLLWKRFEPVLQGHARDGV